MYSLKTNSSFDSAHFLAGYEGKCRNLHGHRWTVEVEVGGEKLMQNGQTRGMVVDFGDLKKDLREKTEEMDHCLIMEKGTLKKKTMEALAEEKMANPVLLLGLPDKFIDHGDVSQLLAMHKLDKNGIITSIQERFGKSADTCSIR